MHTFGHTTKREDLDDDEDEDEDEALAAPIQENQYTSLRHFAHHQET